MNEIVEKIGRENQLNIEQIGDLANETGMVMLGVTHPNEFIGNLADRLEVDKEKARVIAQEINEQIFKKVRDSIRKIHNMREEEERGGGARFSFSGKEGESYETGASSSFQKTQGETLKSEHSREDILKEIEKDHTQENLVPEIMKANANPFEEKMKEGVLIAPVEEKLLPEPEKPKKYQGFDPYKEPID